MKRLIVRLHLEWSKASVVSEEGYVLHHVAQLLLHFVEGRLLNLFTVGDEVHQSGRVGWRCQQSVRYGRIFIEDPFR